MNQWGIPNDIEVEVLKRDKKCVYCNCTFLNSIRKKQASWEHIINDIKITTLENIARCCIGCNASKGNKTLKVWINSKYCIERNIKLETMAPIIKLHIKRYWNE
jgi:hypothetical protein